MAIINGQVPPPLPATERDAPPRVVVRLRSDATARAFLADPADLSRESGVQWEQLSRAFPGVRPRPYFRGQNEQSLSALVGRAKTEKGRSRAARLARYVAIEIPRGVSVEEVAKAVAAWPAVETAYPDERPTPPPVDATDDPRSANQGYLDAAPDGIDARWVWSAINVDGSGVGVVDMEQGWTLNHEDLVAAGITLISGDSFAYHGHGTAVLGELVSVDNTLGCIGIAPGASARVVSQWRSGAGYDTAEAILSAVAVMNAGDVLLLEAQSSYPGASGYVPVEAYDAVFDAIEFATSEGIVVVEAGGNGSVDLDLFQDFDGKQILNRNSADFRDSGAIIVGGASSTAPHQRLWFSNFGSRIDCFGWGANIDTCGDGWTGTSTSAYTSSFGGTSGASPIVTGAAVLLQSWRVGQGSPPFGPYVIRDLLSDASVNTASANPGADRIGVMPNLRAVIERQQVVDLLNSRRWVAVVLILFGVIQDGGGIVIKPGSGPIPIDPWGPLQPVLAMHKRDVLAALAATEIAALLSDESARKAVTKASLDAIGKAIENLRATL